MSTPSLVLKKVSNGQDRPIAGTISVGRSEESNLRLLEDKTSRNHALISTDGAQVFVEDLGSANGTFVNGRRIDAKTKVKLSAGDRLRFDIEEFVLWDAAPAAAPAPPADLDKTQYRAPAAREPEPAKAAPPAKNEAPARNEDPAKNEAPARNEDPARNEASAKSGLPDAFGIDGGNKTVFVPKKAKPKAAVVHADDLQPASGDQPYLLVTSGVQTGGKIELSIEAGAKKTWTIGSGADRTICFAETGVSAKHALLKYDNTWELKDDLSLSGTYLNDTKIFRDHLSDGDRLMFGPVECVFRIPPPTPTQDAGRARLKKIGIILAIACALTLALIFIVSRLRM